MRTPLILTELQKYSDADAARFHMPGHKGNEDFSKLFGAVDIDITELSFSGCLSSNEGVTFEAEKQIAEIMGASRSFIVTDGSSAAVLAMIYVASKFGKKLIIPRESHKSVYNGLQLFGMEPLFLPAEDAPFGNVSAVENLTEILKNEKDVAGALLTSPDYYGRVQNLTRAREILHGFGKLLLIDGAHGAHLRFCSPDLYAGEFADIWVDGVHKTLPCLTQAALLHVKCRNLERFAEDGLSFFRTTSPSYPIMASAEFGVYFSEDFGKEGFARIFAEAERLKNKAKNHGYVFPSPEDEAKIIIDCYASKVNGANLSAFLEKHGIFSEFFDGRYIVFMISPFTRSKDFDRLLDALIGYRAQFGVENVDNVRNRAFFKIPCRKMPYCAALNSPCEVVSAEDAAGKISAANVGFFPPCFPVVTAGEVIDGDVAQALADAPNSFGLQNKMFKVIK